MFQTVYESLPGLLRPLRRAAPSGASAPACEQRARPARIEVFPTDCKPPCHAEDDSGRERPGRCIQSRWPGPLAAPCGFADLSKLMVGPMPLEGVRHAFTLSLIEIRTVPARSLRYRIGMARSLHEPWQLRPEVFNLVSRHLDQAGAARRLARLNRHFPTRAPRSSFGAPAGPPLRGEAAR